MHTQQKQICYSKSLILLLLGEVHQNNFVNTIKVFVNNTIINYSLTIDESHHMYLLPQKCHLSIKQQICFCSVDKFYLLQPYTLLIQV